MTIEEKVGRAIVIQARMKLQECPPEAREAALLFVIRELRKLLGEPARSPSAAMKFRSITEDLRAAAAEVLP